MFTVTVRAASMIRDLIDRSDMPAGAGLRIARRDDRRGLAMALAAEPGDHDQVFIEHDAPVFLGRAAAKRVGDQTLDASKTDLCSAFYLRD